MKKYLYLSLITIAAIIFYSCEKDDICPDTTPTTPRLVIEFYDFSNPTVLKQTTALSAFGNNDTTGVIFNEAVADSTKYFASATKVMLPIDISQDTTSYRLRIRSTSPNPLVYNDDYITLNYARKEIYVSRACGYKTNFDLLAIARNPNSNDNTDQWIRNLTIETSNIDNENDVHVKIYW